MAKGLLSPSLRMEIIDFQLKDSFGPDLEAVISKFEEKCKKGFTGLEVQKLPYVQELEKLIFSRLKMKVSLNTNECLAAVIPFFLGENAVLIKKIWRKKFILAEQTEKIETGYAKGTVDEARVVLGGVFSEYTTTVYMNFPALFELGLNSKEITSVLLHELGHAFYSCAYASRMDRCNQIVSDALRKGDNKDKDKFVEITYKELKGSYKEIRKEAVENLTSTNPAVLCKGAYEILSEIILQQQESSHYDNTSFEQLADNFTARFGYGEHEVTGLEKLYPNGLKGKYYDDAIHHATFTLAIIVKFFLSLSGMSFWGSVLFGLGNVFIKILSYFKFVEAASSFIFALLFGYYLLKTSGESGKDYTYDELEKRYNRIRAQIIEAIKNRELSKKDAEALIESAEMIGSLIKDVKPYRGPLDFMFNTFNPKDIRAKNSIARQQAIEDLMTNDLFLTSMKLKVNA